MMGGEKGFIVAAVQTRNPERPTREERAPPPLKLLGTAPKVFDVHIEEQGMVNHLGLRDDGN